MDTGLVAVELRQLSCHPPGLKGMRKVRDKDVDLTSEVAQQRPWEELSVSVGDVGSLRWIPREGTKGIIIY